MKTSHSTARNAAAVEKIFNDHYSQAKITAGAAARSGAQGSPTVWNELPSHTLHEPAPAPSPPSTYVPPLSKKPVKSGVSTKERKDAKSRSRLFPQPSAGIEAFTDGDILAGKNIQPDWQRPSNRDVAHYSHQGRPGEEEDGAGGGMLTDLDEERLGPHKSRKPLHTSVSQQEKEFRMVSERMFGAAAAPPLAPEVFSKQWNEAEGSGSPSAPLGVGRPGNAIRDLTHVDTMGETSVSQGNLHTAPTTTHFPPAPVQPPHRVGGSMDGRRGDRPRSSLHAAPTPPVTDYRASSTPPSAGGNAAWEEGHPSPMSYVDHRSRQGGAGPRPNGRGTPSVPPISDEEREVFHLHRHGRSPSPAVEVYDEYGHIENEASGSPAAPTAAMVRRDGDRVANQEVYPWRWRRDDDMEEILTEKKRLEAMGERVRKDPHRSNSAMKNAKRRHIVYIPSSKGSTDHPAGAIPRLREPKYDVAPLRRTSSEPIGDGRGGGQGGDGRAAAAATTRPYRAAPLPPGKLRQLSQQRKAQQQHEESIRRYEETLPLRRVADPYVPRADQHEKVQDAKGVGVPNEYTLQVLSDTHQGLHPITGNAYRQQLLRGEPLIRRVMRGDFYNAPGAGEYAVPRYEEEVPPPSVSPGPTTRAPTTAPPALPVSSQALPPPVFSPAPLPPHTFPFAPPTTTTTAPVPTNSSSCFSPPQWEEKGKAVLGGGGRTGNGNRSRHHKAQADPRYDRLPRVSLHSIETDPGHGNDRPYKKNFLQRNKEEVQKYSDRNTQYRYYLEQMEARRTLPPRNKG